MIYGVLLFAFLLAMLICFRESFRDGVGYFLQRNKIFLGLLIVIFLIVANVIGWATLGKYIPTALSLGMQLLFAVLFMLVQFGAMMYFMSRARVYWIMPGESGVSFADYKGNPHVLRLAQDTVRCLKAAADKDFKEMGAEPVRGLLLEGPPGTGKSYLGVCMSTEALVPFAYCSSASLQSAFMGMSAMTIWRLYKKGGKLADRFGGCILFFDELDAIGQARQGGGMGMMGGMMFGGGSQILNELLTQMDPPPTTRGFFKKISQSVRKSLGFKVKTATRPNILTMGATNLVSILDKALLRPGRFDRQITVDLPDSEGRGEIIRYRLGKVKHNLSEQEIERLKRRTTDYSPVQLKHIINEGVIIASAEGRKFATFDDIRQAQDTFEWGVRQPLLSMSDEEKERIAYHEAGHAVAQVLLRKRMRIEKATIIRRAGALGLVGSKPVREYYTSTKKELLENIYVSFASRAVELDVMGIEMNGFTGDLRSATAIALGIVGSYGMGSKLLAMDAIGSGTSGGVQKEANELNKWCMALTREFIKQNLKAVQAVAQALLQKEDLDGPEVEEIVYANDPWEPESLEKALPEIKLEDFKEKEDDDDDYDEPGKPKNTGDAGQSSFPLPAGRHLLSR